MISAGTVFTNDVFPRATIPDLRAALLGAGRGHAGRRWSREGATIGARAVIGSDLAIGRFAMVGMGAVVTRTVPDFHLVVGHPARIDRCRLPLRSPDWRGEPSRTPPHAGRLQSLPTPLRGARRRGAGAASYERHDEPASRRAAMTMVPQRWGVVGGGMLGLTLALKLARQGHAVTLLEASDRLGGLADAWQLGDVTWDRHYHVTLLSDLHLRGLLGGTRPRRRAALGDDAGPASTPTDSSTRCPTARFSAVPAARPDRQAAPGRHDLLRLADRRRAAARESLRRRLADATVGQPHLAGSLAAAAARQARRQLAARLGRVHLGDHPPHVRRAAHGAEEGDVRLRRGRLRAHPRALAASLLGEAGVEHRDPRRGRASIRRDGRWHRRAHASGVDRSFDRVVVTAPARRGEPALPGPRRATSTRRSRASSTRASSARRCC